MIYDESIDLEWYELNKKSTTVYITIDIHIEIFNTIENIAKMKIKPMQISKLKLSNLLE